MQSLPCPKLQDSRPGHRPSGSLRAIQQISERLRETTLPNGMTIHGDVETSQRLQHAVKEFPSIWLDQGKSVDLPQDEWMRIPLRSDWESRISGKAKVYPLGTKDKALIDATFDELHEQGRLSWTAGGATPFSYPVFVTLSLIPL